MDRPKSISRRRILAAGTAGIVGAALPVAGQNPEQAARPKVPADPTKVQGPLATDVGVALAVRASEARVARRAAHVEPDAAPGSRRHHHAVRSAFRAASRRRAGDRSEAVLAADSRHGRSAAGLHARRSAPLPRQIDDSRDGVLGQRRPRVSPRRQPDRPHAAADRRADEHERMDRRAARDAAARSRRLAEGHVVSRRRHGRRGDDAQHSDREGVGRCAHRVRTERRAAAAGTGLPGAAVPARRRRQREREVAAPHRAWRSAVHDARGNLEVHRSAARRHRAHLQPRHGCEVAHHRAVVPRQADRARLVGDPRHRVERTRQDHARRHQRRRRQDVDSRRSSTTRCCRSATRASACRGNGRAAKR